jgi:predicted butyrate kinase (DUF1464 family)
VAGTAAKVYVLAGRAVIVIAVGATKMVDGLAGEGFGGKSGAGDDDLAVFVLETGSGGLEFGHFFRFTACFVRGGQVPVLYFRIRCSFSQLLRLDA